MYTGTRAGVFQGKRPEKLWQEAAGKISQGEAKCRLGIEACGAQHDSLREVMKKKAIGWLDFEETHSQDNYNTAIFRKLRGNISSGAADLTVLLIPSQLPKMVAAPERSPGD